MPIPRTDLNRIAAKHGCNVVYRANGAAHIEGEEPQLRQVWGSLWRQHRLAPRFVVSSKVDGVEQAGFPRIEVHPQVVSLG